MIHDVHYVNLPFLKHYCPKREQETQESTDYSLKGEICRNYVFKNSA